jgi:hypothetical protein
MRPMLNIACNGAALPSAMAVLVAVGANAVSRAVDELLAEPGVAMMPRDGVDVC